MKKLVSISILMVIIGLLFAACAPAAGRSTVQYQAMSQDIINAVAEIGITMQPNSSFNFFSINGISDRFITLQADSTGAVSFFFGNASVVLNFSALQNGDIVTLAASGQGNGTVVNDSIDRIIQQLDARFSRVR